MKIDFPPVRCFDEAAIFPGEEVLDAAVACFRIMLHLTAKFAHDVFDLSHCGVEGLPDRDQRVFALGRVGMGLVDDDLVVLGHRDAKLDLEAAAPMSGLRPGDDDATTRNARTEFFETLHLRGDLGSDLFGRLAMPKGDVDWSLHIDPSPPPNKANDTPLIARRLAADQLPRRALAGSLTTNRRYRPSYSSPPNSDLHRRDLQWPLNADTGRPPLFEISGETGLYFKSASDAHCLWGRNRFVAESRSLDRRPS